MANNFTYLHSLFSDLDYPDDISDEEWWALEFRYDMKDFPKEFAIHTACYSESGFDNVEKEVFMAMSLFTIERNEVITGEQIYGMIEKSVTMMNRFLKLHCEKLQRTVIQTFCPPMADMEADIENLMIDMNIR